MHQSSLTAIVERVLSRFTCCSMRHSWHMISRTGFRSCTRSIAEKKTLIEEWKTVNKYLKIEYVKQVSSTFLIILKVLTVKYSMDLPF